MDRVKKLPSVFKRYRSMGGVLDFAVFENSAGTAEEIVVAISQLLTDWSIDADATRTFKGRKIDDRTFFGDWYDLKRDRLVMRGVFTAANGSQLENPGLMDLARVRVTSSGSPLPEVGGGGQFAYAFVNPPYPLRSKAAQIQSTFDEIRNFILPPDYAANISDFSSPDLVRLSDYFVAGADWWGIFLFAVHIPAIRRLTIIAGSTTD